ncbi:MAG: RNA 2',3'-cyclic phosphodiesterase [Pseudomonadota bacterium]|nr:RNA 2',3'-cyclic phosphodiesterase [Pseudomonadales bacterium]MDY6918840.1 RNA 2',3'-cyclic phosphodiesterase [Pseudomonadota bacterium]
MAVDIHSNTSQRTLRTFLGVPVPDSVNDALAPVVRDLAQSPPDRGVRWVAPGNRHLTLAFLGDQPPATLARLQSRLQPLLMPLPAFTLHSRMLMGFPDAKSPIVALEFERSEPLDELVQNIRGVLQPLDLPREQRPLRPHVTLGRLPRGRGWQQPPQPLPLSLPVQSVVLYQSRLTEQGAQYTPLWRLPLRH